MGRKQPRSPSAWKWMTIVFLFAGSSGLMDPMTLSSPEESEEVNQDFLALSDVANATQNFRVRRSELTCANGDCGGGDVLKVVSQLAKRLLSDPRILRRNSAIFARKGRANSSPFTAASYYQSPGDNVQMESLRNDRYVDYESSDNNFRDPFKQTQGFGADSGGFFDDYVDNSVQSDDSSIANVADRDGGGHDSYSAGHDSYSAGHDSYSGGQESYGGGHDSYGGSSYGGSSYGGSSYGGSYSEGCCENKYLPILLVGSLGLLAFYLYLRSTTTTAAAAARRYDQNDEDISDGRTCHPASAQNPDPLFFCFFFIEFFFIFCFIDFFLIFFFIEFFFIVVFFVVICFLWNFFFIDFFFY